MSTKQFEFWFDYSSPFAYLASTQVDALAQRTGAEIVWRPFLLGGLFKLIGTADVPLFTWPQPKQRYYMQDMLRHADLYGAPFRWPSSFPMLTVTPLRLTLAAGPATASLCHAIFHAYWAEDRNINDPTELGRLLESVGLAPALLERTKEPELKEALKRNTEEARDKGLCGAPSFVVDSMVFWGQDRLHFVEKALGGWRPASG